MATLGALIVQLVADTASFGRDLGRARDLATNAGRQMEGSFTGVGRAASGLNPVLAKVTADTLPVQSAFRTLGLTSSHSLEDARARITKAYDTIKGSGIASTADLFRAHAAYEVKLKDLSARAMPDFALAQNKAAVSFKDMAAGFSQAGAGSGILSAALSAITNPITAVGASLALTVVAAKSFTDALIDNAKGVRELMAVSGLGAAEADNFGDTLKLLGADAGAVQIALFKLGQEVDEGGANLRRLGISVREAGGTAKTEGALFLEVRDRISEIGSASQRSAILQDVFGRSARALAPVFALNREEFRRWAAVASDLSPWSEEAQRRTMALIIAENQLAGAWSGLKEQLALLLAGPSEGLLTWLADALRHVRELAEHPGWRELINILSEIGRLGEKAGTAVRSIVAPPAPGAFEQYRGGERQGFPPYVEPQGWMDPGAARVWASAWGGAFDDVRIMLAGLSEQEQAALRDFEEAQSHWRFNYERKISPFNQGQWPTDEEIAENQRRIRDQMERMRRENPRLYERLPLLHDGAGAEIEAPGLVRPVAWQSGSAGWQMPGEGGLAPVIKGADEIRKLLLEVAGRRQEVLDSLTLMGALVAQQAQLGLKADTDLLKAQLGHLEQRRHAEEAYYDEMIGLINQGVLKDDQAGTEKLKLTQARLTMRAEMEARAIGLETQVAITLERETQQTRANLEAWRQLGNAEEAAALAAQRFGLMVDEYVGGRVREIEGMLTTVQAQALIGEKTDLDLLEAQLRAVRERAKVEQEALEARQFHLEETKGEFDPAVDIARVQTEQKIADIRAKAGRDELMLAAQIDRTHLEDAERRQQAFSELAQREGAQVLDITEWEKPWQGVREAAEVIALQSRYFAEQSGFFAEHIDQTAGHLAAVRAAMEQLIARRVQLELELEKTIDPEGIRDRIHRTDEELIRLQGHFLELRRIEGLKTIFRDVFAAAESGIADTIRGVLQGTQTLEQALNRMAENVGLSIVENLLKRALKPLEDELIKLVEWLAKIGFKWITPTVSPSVTPGQEPLAEGGIVRSPTRALIGEAGPEAVIPLDRAGSLLDRAIDFSPLLSGLRDLTRDLYRMPAGVGESPAAGGAANDFAGAVPALGRMLAAGLRDVREALARSGPAHPPAPTFPGLEGLRAALLGLPAVLKGMTPEPWPIRPYAMPAPPAMPARVGWSDDGAMGRPGDQGAPIVHVENTVEIIDQRQSGTIQRQEGRGPDGQKVISMMIRDEVNAMGNDGGIDRMLRTNYGVTRRGVTR